MIIPQVGDVDDGAASFKVERFLKSQAAEPSSSPEDPNAPLPEDAKVQPGTHGLFERIGGVLPQRLREAAMAQINKRAGGSHSHSMSLGLPSSGGPFGPSVLSALGLRPGSEKAASDAGADDGPALGQRPQISRGRSDGDQLSLSQPSANAPAWKALGMGFGYDIEEENEEEADASVDKAEQEKKSVDIPDDLRTNPSEDADTSDVDDDDDASAHSSPHDSRQARLDGTISSDPQYDLSDADALQTYSNPSDEEAAREARKQRRKARKMLDAQGVPRRRALTGGTLPSSSIGEGEVVTPMNGGAQRAQQDILSNPSDEGAGLDYGTFGESDEEFGRTRPAPLKAGDTTAPNTAPSLNPTAKVFQFGGKSSAATSAPANYDNVSGAPTHFRLPSIQHSSFGGSAFSGVDKLSDRKSLSATAPAFTPSAFTFQAPGGAPKLPQRSAIPAQQMQSSEEPGRANQGREKRQRFGAGAVRGPLDDFDEDEEDSASNPVSAPAASNGFDASAGSFMPTWARAAPAQPSKRPGPPNFQGPVAKDLAATTLLTKPVSKPISIRKPDEFEASAGDDTITMSVPKPAAQPFTFTSKIARSANEPKSSLTAMLDAHAGSTPPQHAISNKRHHPRDASISLSEAFEDGSKEDNVEEELQDIIEELGQRLDKSLEHWADRILHEVHTAASAPSTKAMSQVAAPAADQVAPMKSLEQKLSESLNELSSRVSNLMTSVQAQSASVEVARRDSDTRPKSDEDDSYSKGPGGHRPLDAQGELDFDYVQDVLDSRMDNMLERLQKVFQSALIDAARKEAESSEGRSKEATELSAEAIGRLADTVGFRVRSAVDNLQAILLDAVHEQPRAILSSVEENGQKLQGQLQALTPIAGTMESLKDTLDKRFERFEAALAEGRSAIADSVEVSLVNAITPHLESLRQEHLDADVLAARVTSGLIPLLDGHRSDAPDQIVETILKELRPKLQSLPSQESLSPTIAGSMTPMSEIQKTISAELREHSFNLDPVIALMEPLLSKQEDAKSMVKQVLARQSEIDNTLSFLPSAINAKTEIFLSAAQQSQEVQKQILERLTQFADESDISQVRASNLEDERDDLLQKLDKTRHEAAERHADVNEARAELSAANSYISTLKDEVTRLEGRLEEAEKASAEASEQISDMRSRQRDAVEAQHAAERRADEAAHRASSLEQALGGTQSTMSSTQQRLDQALEQLSFDREERRREREASAQATADLLSRLERADFAAEEAKRRADAYLHTAQKAEHQAKEATEELLQRSSRAEGEVVALEKRITDQDNKIANLRELTATQKQKAAQSQQKISEAEKKAKEHEAMAQDYAVAQARLADMESRLGDQEELHSKIRASQEVEMVSQSPE